MGKSFDDFEGDVPRGGKKIIKLRYADNTTLIAASESEREEMLKRE